MRKIFCISCYELCTENITGIQRYLQECLVAMDNILWEKKLDMDIRVCYPEGFSLNLPDLKVIKKIGIKNIKNKKWNTQVFKSYVKSVNGIFVGMANNLSISKNSVVAIHDVRALDTNKFESFAQRLLFFLQVKCTALFSDYIITVSEYQKKIISQKLRFQPDRIVVTYNGYEHINRFAEDDSILKKYNLIDNEYYYTLGSVAKHKNYKWILEVANRNKDKTFVVAGGELLKKWGTDSSDFACKNIKYVGYVTDEQNKALLSNCKAYIQPSLYEGFGIPPLEALALRKPIFVSTATCLPEIYNGLANFFDPNDYDVNLDDLFYPENERLTVALNQYSWNAVAEKWITVMKECSDKYD